MITTNIKNWMLFAVLLGLLLFSTTATAKIEVVLGLDDPEDPTALEIITNNSKCDGAILDCIDVPPGNSPFIFFRLPNACGSGDDDPQYQLTSMRITLVEKIWPTVTSPLYSEVADDFKADPNTGYIDFGKGNNEKRKHKLKFKNDNSRAYTVFYEIAAKHCTDGSKPKIYLDPEIRNKG
jgi:hypothetical protein